MSVPMKVCCETSVDCINILALICDVSFLYSKCLALHKNCAIQDTATNGEKVFSVPAIYNFSVQAYLARVVNHGNIYGELCVE